MKTRKSFNSLKKKSKANTIKASYSPSINKKLNIQSISAIDKSLKFCDKLTSINIGTSNEPECLEFENSKLVNILLNNLKSKKKLDPKFLVPPKQVMDNCWFNTMFVAFFFSDKGKKFFKFFRQMMITGKRADGSTIENVDIKRLLFLLNILIEASYGKNNKSSKTIKINKKQKLTKSKNVGKKVERNITKNSLYNQFNKLTNNLHTNFFIYNIYNTINRITTKSGNFKTQLKLSIPNIKNAGNPLDYYQKIMGYLNYDILKIKTIDLFSHYNKESLSYINENIKNNTNSIPDVLVIEDHQSSCIHETNYKLSINNKNYTYKLDSIILTNKGHYDPKENSHFVCVLTLNGIEYKFDGDSESKLDKFKWKHLINVDKDWAFKENWKYVPEKYNFRKGYKMMFYYRS